MNGSLHQWFQALCRRLAELLFYSQQQKMSESPERLCLNTRRKPGGIKAAANTDVLPIPVQTQRNAAKILLEGEQTDGELEMKKQASHSATAKRALEVLKKSSC